MQEATVVSIRCVDCHELIGIDGISQSEPDRMENLIVVEKVKLGLCIRCATKRIPVVWITIVRCGSCNTFSPDYDMDRLQDVVPMDGQKLRIEYKYNFVLCPKCIAEANERDARVVSQAGAPSTSSPSLSE